jgi:hypothetical protein
MHDPVSIQSCSKAVSTRKKTDGAPKASSENATEFLDRHRALPLILLVVLPFVLQLPLLLSGRSTDPIWFVSGLTQGSRLLPSFPFIDPNVGFTSEALGRLAAWDWVHGIVPWWNPYTGIGMPLAGELQPGAFFLPFTLLFLLRGGVLWQQILMQIIAGFTTYALLRELGLSRLAALMGGALFALNGTIAWTPGPAAVYCSQPFLPLLLWGIERSRKQYSGAASILAIALATAWSLLAGFPEPAYISGLLALTWGLYRLVCEQSRWVMLRRAIAGWAIGMLVAAPLLIAFADYIRQSDSFGIHKLGEESLSWHAFSVTVMPYVYGLVFMGFHSLPLYHIWANIGGYTSVLILLLAVVALTSGSRERGLKFLLLAWVLLAFAKTFGLQPVMALMNHLPLLRQTDFLRYAPPSWGLALIILASFGLDEFKGDAPGWRRPFGIALGLLAICTVLAWPKQAFWQRPQSFLHIMFALLAASLLCSLAGLLAAFLAWRCANAEWRRTVLAGILVLDAAVMFGLPELSNVRPKGVDYAAIHFLRNHQGLSRTYTLGPIQPNYGAYFQVASIDHNVLPVPKLWADFVDRDLLPGLWRRFSGATFWPGVYGDGVGERALSQNLANYLNLAVRYVITNPGQSPTPEILVPATDTKDQGSPAEQRTDSLGLKRLSTMLQESCPAASNNKGPSIKCLLIMKAISILGHASPRNPNSSEIGSPDAERMILQNDQSIKFLMRAPTPPVPGLQITGVGVVLDNNTESIDGKLEIQVCAGAICRSGQRALSDSNKDTIFRIPLDIPVVALAGDSLLVTLTHPGSSRPVSLRTSALQSNQQQLTHINGIPTDRVLQMTLGYGSALQGIHRVYSDPQMDIWELPNFAPYFQVIQADSCKFSATRREDVTLDCAAAATLLRRELYMPGWTFKVNGKPAGAVQSDGLFQSVTLPAGRSHVQYNFSPPYITFGWIATAIGLAGVLWQIIRIKLDSGRAELP